MDAPGVRGEQQQLGHLVGRTFTNRERHAQRDADSIPHAQPNPHAATNSHADTATHIHAHADSIADDYSIFHAQRDTHAATNPHADADSNTYADTATNPHAHAYFIADAGSDTVANPHRDADPGADYRRHGAARWQGRRLLSRLAWLKRRDAALSRLRQCGRIAAGAGTEQLQRRYYRDTRRGGRHAIHGLCHRPRPRFGEPELSDSGYSIVLLDSLGLAHRESHLSTGKYSKLTSPDRRPDPRTGGALVSPR